MRPNNVYIICSLSCLIAGCTSTGRKDDSSLGNHSERLAQAVRVVSISTEIEYSIERQRSVFSDLQATHKEIFSGSGFLVNGRLLTARHVIFGPAPSSIQQLGPHRIGHDQYRITARRIRIMVSNLAYKPIGVWAHSASDIAVISLQPIDMDRLRLFPFSIDPNLSLSKKVQVWGFPSTSIPQMTERCQNGGILRIVSVFPDYFVLNGPLGKGYSGGPVLSANSARLLGLVSRSDDRQSRVLRITFDPSRMPVKKYYDGILLQPNEQHFDLHK